MVKKESDEKQQEEVGKFADLLLSSCQADELGMELLDVISHLLHSVPRIGQLHR